MRVHLLGVAFLTVFLAGMVATAQPIMAPMAETPEVDEEDRVENWKDKTDRKSVV